VRYVVIERKCQSIDEQKILKIREQHPKDEVAKLWLDSLVIVEGEEKSG
jgi:hypothetical protein